jgi:hypothetical protein
MHEYEKTLSVSDDIKTNDDKERYEVAFDQGYFS